MEKLVKRYRLLLVVYYRTKVIDFHESGINGIFWNGRNESGSPVASGVYFARFKTADFETSKKMVVVK